MVIFSQILKRNNLKSHDGRPLWKYDITDSEYEELKIAIKENLFEGYSNGINSVLFASQWWKREYSGGSWKWNELLKTLNVNESKNKLFIKNCKNGLERLNIDIITMKNKHFLTTLFVQGGLPLKGITGNNVSGFEQFLKALLKKKKLYGDQIGIFNIDNSPIVNYLPKSFQNVIFYNLSVNIIDAVISENDDDLPFKINSSQILDKLINSLKTENRQNFNLRVPFYIQWSLKAFENNIEFYFTPCLTEKLTNEMLQNLNVDTGENKITLHLNGKEIAVYRRMTNGEYKLYRSKTKPLLWNLKDECLDLRLSNGNKIGVSIQIPGLSIQIPGLDTPDITRPIMFIGENINNLLIEKSGNTSFPKAHILIHESWWAENSKTYDEFGTEIYELEGELFELKSINGNIVVCSDYDQIKFFTNTDSDESDVIVFGKTIEGINGNVNNVICGIPEFREINSEQMTQRIKNKNIEWRFNKKNEWQEWADNEIPIGKIDFKIATSNGTFYKKIFLLGRDFSIKTIPVNGNKGTIVINNCEYDVILSQPEEISVKKNQTANNYEFNIEKINTTTDIKNLRIEFNNKNGNLKFNLPVPFSGAYFCDSEGEKYKENESLCLGMLKGSRLICVGNENDEFKVILKHENSIWNDLSYREILKSGSYPMWEFENKIRKLLALENSTEDLIILEIVDSTGSIQSKIKFRMYNVILSDSDINSPVKICDYYQKEITTCNDLKAFPITENFINLEEKCVGLQYTNDGWTLPDNENPGLWVCFGKVNRYQKCRPSLILHKKDEWAESIYEEFDGTLTIKKRDERIEKLKENFLNKNCFDPLWKIVVSYFDFLIDNSLPLSIIDFFIAIANNPKLTVRFFIACLHHSSLKNEELFEALKAVEFSIPFAWHLIPIQAWQDEIDSYSTALNKKYKTHGAEIVSNILNGNFEKIGAFIIQSINLSQNKDEMDGLFTLISNPKTAKDFGNIDKSMINGLRSKKLEPHEWPGQKKHFLIIECYKQYFIIDNNLKHLRSIVNAPVYSALVVAGKATYNRPHKITRTRFYRNFDPIWYDYIFIHTLNRILHNEEKY